MRSLINFFEVISSGELDYILGVKKVFRLSLFKVGAWTEKCVFQVLDNKAIDTFYHQTEKKNNRIWEKNGIHQRGLFCERKIYPILAHKTRLVGFIMEIVLWAYPLVQQGKVVSYIFNTHSYLRVSSCDSVTNGVTTLLTVIKVFFVEEKLISGCVFSTATL